MKKLFPKLIRTALLLGMPCLVVWPTQAQTQRTVTDATMLRDFQAAMEAEDRGDLDRAQVLLMDLHDHHPGIFEIDESLGLLYAGQEKYSLAFPLLESAVRARPGASVAHANLGAVLYKLHRNAEAMRELQRAIQIDARNVAAQQSLGQVLLDEHKPELAVVAFASALHLKPEDDNLIFSYATALVACRRFDEAEHTLASDGVADKSALAQSLLGEIDEKKGSYQSALHHFARAVELEPSEENAWSLGVELLRHWSFEGAIQEFAAGTVKFPQSERMKLGLGTAYFGNANYKQSVPLFAALLQSDSGNEMYAHLLGLACGAVMDEVHPDCSLLQQYAATHPRDARAAIDAGAYLIQQGGQDHQLTEAGILLNNALQVDPNSAEAHYYQGLQLQQLTQWQQSIAPLERSIAVKPDYAQAHYRLGLAYGRTGRKQEGQQQIALQRQYVKQQQQDLDQRLRQIARFVFAPPEK